MATNQRMMTFVLNVQNEDGVAKTKEFRRAVADVDSTVELLNSSLAENVTVTAKVVQSEKDAVAQARMIINQQQRQVKAVNSVIEQYTNYQRMARMSADSQQIFNAQVAAGVDPLSREGRQIAQVVKQYQALRDAQTNTMGSMRNMRGIAQNLGWQMQDVAVQLQMGTDGFIVLGQQGSQVLSSFGPAGAVAGAALAVISASIPAIITALDDASVSTEEFTRVQERLNEVVDISSSGVVALVDDYRDLYHANERLAKIKARQAIFDTRTAMQEASKSASELSKSILDVDFGADKVAETLNRGGIFGGGTVGTGIKTTSEQFKEMADTLGILEGQAVELSNAYQTFTQGGNLSDLADVVSRMALSAKDATPEFTALAKALDQAVHDTDTYNEVLELATKLLNGEFVPELEKSGKSVETVAQRYARMTEQLMMNSEEIAVNNYMRKEALKDSPEVVKATEDQIRAYFSEKKVIDDLNESLKQEEELRKQQKQTLESTTSQITRMQSTLSRSMSSFDPVGSEESKHAANLTKLKSYYDSIATISDPAYKEEVLRETRRVNELIELEEQRHAMAMEQAQLEQWENINSAADMYVTSMSVTVDLLSTYGSAITDQMAEMNAAQKIMFIMQQSIAASNAILGGYQAAAAWKMQSIGIGPISAEVMAQASIAAGYAQAGTIAGFTFAGAFDNGGYIPSGSAGIVSEYQDELVNGVLVKGPATVTGSSDTARIMNNQTDNTNVGGVTIVQHISANGDKAIEIMTKQAAQQGAQQGYAMMLNDLKSNGKGRQILRKSAGV